MRKRSFLPILLIAESYPSSAGYWAGELILCLVVDLLVGSHLYTCNSAAVSIGLVFSGRSKIVVIMSRSLIMSL